jgi:hypothetical protein
MERGTQKPRALLPAFSRVIGEAREFKGYLKVLSCDERGLAERVLQKRDAPTLFKEVRAAETLPLYAWQEEEGRIVGGRGVGDVGDAREASGPGPLD